MLDRSADSSRTTAVTHVPSETAAATATLRALAAHDPREASRGPDTMAELFLTEEQKAPLVDARIREWVMKNKITPGAYEFIIARTRFFDDAVLKAIDDGIPQLVLLGAGYDSRPYRFSVQLGASIIYEVDAAPTQMRKRELLQAGGVSIPPNVRFVTIDLASGDLAEALVEAGYSKGEQGLFVWEGVTYYLPKEAVDRTLAAVSGLARPGSLVAFDFASLSPETLSEDAVKRLREQMSANRPAEPTKFGIPRGNLESFLEARGFRVRELLQQEEMEAKYLTMADGSRIGHVPALFNLVLAQVV